MSILNFIFLYCFFFSLITITNVDITFCGCMGIYMRRNDIKEKSKIILWEFSCSMHINKYAYRDKFVLIYGRLFDLCLNHCEIKSGPEEF